jgi:magnesium-protoporphyrin O-methyltransferase
MSCDCCKVGLDEMFSDRIAKHEAKQFRRKGLPVRSRRLLKAIESRLPLEGVTTREVGAGVGGFTITLLKRGVAKASIVDAVAAYVSEARRLATDYDVAAELELEVADYVDRASDLPDADLVVMDRVVCCYPVWRDLLLAAAADSRRMLALSYPRDALWVRLGVGAVNLMQRIRRQTFRVFVHPPREMHQMLRDKGFHIEVVGYRGVWELAIAVRDEG